jgi:hypothetical protein
VFFWEIDSCGVFWGIDRVGVFFVELDRGGVCVLLAGVCSVVVCDFLGK